MTFLFELSTPTTINFEPLLTDPTGERTGQLAAANAARGAMRTALKECEQNSGKRDWSKAVKTIEDYLPHLLGLMDAIEKDILLMPTEIVFGWRSTLSPRRVRSSSRITCPSFYYELAYVLLNLGFALSNTSNSLVSSMGSYEIGTEADRRAGDAKLNSAAETLCRASGIFEFLSREIIPQWEKRHPDGLVHLRSTRPPELSREAASGLAQQTLADAERLAIRRLLSRSAMDRHAHPGAGLPKSHPSPALLAKLELNVHQLYSSAKDAYKLASGLGEIASSLRSYVSEGRQVALGRGYKWLALEAGEQANQNGEAIGWLGLARETMKAVCSGSVLAVRNGSLKNDWARKKGKVEQELEEIDKFLKAYEQLNRTVTFEPIPAGATLLTRVPGGRAALNMKPYSMPSPMQRDFGSYTNPGVVDWADSDDEDAPSSTREPDQAYC
ncbi:hypothetical protein PCANC_21939 [Puccinia coronata f. sp. avenae]|uniref:pH-response regulator protein palC n=1 Tax=Puccinia coronata f. sp. avenae TaxID=200324 RepID=A0A2N5TDT2_9BASI|nr:hypothetical protein PCANC_21939 [Puccinia coronata f. sp. avenae]PLW23641.1 hypothetical protein PCASD_12365 [Puccinia coronata f. sp. avenae]PLW50139.1 hypothetical protein PCASD_01779 [Puccinia coronata f. sp. avenae]